MNRETNSPYISVILPVYKGDNYLKPAIESILYQSYTDFELLILCDNPTTETQNLLNNFKKNDKRIIVYFFNNFGLINSLNYGIKKSNGEYIARMDSDDISFKDRFRIQIDFLENNPNIDIIGSEIQLINKDGNIIQYSISNDLYLSPNIVRWKLMFHCCIHHPTVMMRKAIFLSRTAYSPEFIHAEDYELWLRLAPKVNIAILPDILLQLRKHEKNISKLFNEIQRNNANKAVFYYLNDLFQLNLQLSDIVLIRFPDIFGTKKLHYQYAELIFRLQKLYCLNYNLDSDEKHFIKRDALLMIFRYYFNKSAYNPISYILMVIWAMRIDFIEAIMVLYQKIKKYLRIINITCVLK